MLEKMIKLDTMDSVRRFVDIALQKDCDIELISGKYVVNAKSIMDVFSLDLTRPIKMVAHCDMFAELSKQIEPYIHDNS